MGRKKLILVDDEPRNLALLTALLEGEDLDMRTAQDGRSALEAISMSTPDLVLLDLAMPGLDGVDVLLHMRAMGGPHIPVIVVTAHSDRDQRLRAMQAGADEFLEKPIDGALLRVRVRTLLALKASRDELAERHAALAELQREQRELMQFIIHDLRTPLQIVSASVAFAGENLERDPAESVEALREATDSLVRVNDLVSDMLAVSRLEQADAPITRDLLWVDALLSRVVQTYTRKARALDVELECNAVHAGVHADGALLRRVLENIVDNSIRHTPSRGRVVLDAECQNSKLKITVSNSGPPIPADERETVFEKFVRGRSPSSRPGAVGLGLYFCKRVIEAHGGRIHVEETAKWPTSFVIALPWN